MFLLILKPVEVVEIETAVGKFRCLEISSNTNQIFYVSQDEKRYTDLHLHDSL